MLLYLMLTSMFILIDGKILKRHVPNCVEPHELEESYSLSGWVNHLHLQQCVFVAIGENFYALFLEKIPRPYDDNQEIREYFLGICDYRTLKKWNLCPLPVETKRKEDCSFREDNQTPERVHRRLCELSDLSQFAEHCNCDVLLRGDKLFDVTGFPTCFRQQVFETICGYNNVCGLESCAMSLVASRIYTVKCSDDCFGHKPFCENPEWVSAKVREISSFWTDWSEPKCADSECQAQYTEASCINRDTGLGDVDCLGPGTSCCSNDLCECKCHVFVEDGISKVIRTFSVPAEQEYEDLSLEEIIKNLPVKNEHRQMKVKEKKIHSKPISGKSSRDIAYDDTYDHAHNVKILKENLHARDFRDKGNFIQWLQEPIRKPPIRTKYYKSLQASTARPDNIVEPKMDQKILVNEYPQISGRKLTANERVSEQELGFALSNALESKISPKVKERTNDGRNNILPGQYWVDPYVKQSLYKPKLEKHKSKDEYDISDDDSYEDIKQLDAEGGSDEDEDIKIDESDVTYIGSSSALPESDEIREQQMYDRFHPNATVLETPDANQTKRTESGGFSCRVSRILSVQPILVYCLIDFL